jgi:cytochrome P450
VIGGLLILVAITFRLPLRNHVSTPVSSSAKEYLKAYLLLQPMLPHSFLFGHLVYVAKLMMKQPKDTSGLYTPLLLLREQPELFDCGVAYLDVWPINSPMLAVFHPDMMAQFTQDISLPKHEMMRYEFMPFTECNDLVNQEGQVWKTWRGVFNPGFSAKNLLTFVPEMVEEILVFKDWMKSAAASGEVKTLENQAAKLTLDVIGRAVL